MRSLSDILADPNGGSRMSGWIFCVVILLAGIFGAFISVDGFISGKSTWWMGIPLAALGLAEGIKFARYWRRHNAR